MKKLLFLLLRFESFHFLIEGEAKRRAGELFEVPEGARLRVGLGRCDPKASKHRDRNSEPKLGTNKYRPRIKFIPDLERSNQAAPNRIRQ